MEKINNKYNERWYVVAADVKALYPSVSRPLIEKALKFALEKSSQFKIAVIKNIIQLTVFCLDNVVIKHKEQFFKQANGIITGDNHSVSIANITMHYVIWPIAKHLEKNILFKRFIDDIIWLLYGDSNTRFIRQSLEKAFQDHNLELTIRSTNTQEPNSRVEFLDVEHVTQSDAPGGFITKDFVKPTALDRRFLNGKSFHTPHNFKSIVFGEAVRLRRINENDADYQKSLTRLQKKCDKSNFSMKMVLKVIQNRI